VLAEDYAMLAQIRARGLDRLGCSVFVAESAESALRHLALNKADVIVADLGLPGRDGVSLLNEAARLYPGIGRILISGQITDEAREWADQQEPKVEVILKGEDGPDVLPRAVLRACAQHGP
jgi:CheY-like chemotaxis protein